MQNQKIIVKTYLTYFLIFTVVIGVSQQILSITRSHQVPQTKNEQQKISENNSKFDHTAQDQKLHSKSRQTKRNKAEKITDQEYLDKIVDDENYIQPRQLKFVICTQSYSNVFQQMKQQINNLYPDVIIISQEYPLPSQKQILSYLISILQYGMFFIFIMGNKVQAIARHPLYHKFVQNKWTVVIGVYFLINMLKNSVTGTGAFEIYLQKDLIFSKLGQNRMPDVKQIIAKL